MIRLHLSKHKWMWLFLSLWLTVIQSAAVAHAAQHSLVQEHNDCVLCNFGNHQSSGPLVTLPSLGADDTAIAIVLPFYQQPRLAQCWTPLVRAPPLLSLPQ